MQNNNTGKNEQRVYYSRVANLHRKPNAPLDECVFDVSGEVSFAEKKTYTDKKSGEQKEYVSINLTAVLGDKLVESLFGPNLVNADHKVEFRFALFGATAQNFLTRTPRWGQDIIFMLHNMKVEEFTRRNGEKGYNVAANCDGYSALGSTKKADGTDRPQITIRGLEGGTAKPAAKNAAPASVNEAMSNMEMDFGDDDELPF